MTHRSVVTLLPAATEIVYALGIEPVATSHACDYPPAASDLPTACYSTISGATSEEINTSVANIEPQQNNGYHFDRSVLKQTKPDVVITQGICDVCAVDQSTVTSAIEALDCSPEIVTCHPHSFEEVLDSIHTIGLAINRESAATTLVSSLRNRIQRVTDAVPETTQSVAVLDWMDPLMLAGHWVPDMIQLAGGTSRVHSSAGSGPIPWKDLRAYDPETLIVAPCGFSLAQTAQNVTELTTRPKWESLTAVTHDNVVFIDGNDYMNRPGPRLIDSLELLAHILHPTHVSPPPDSTTHRLSTLTAASDTSPSHNAD